MRSLFSFIFLIFLALISEDVFADSFDSPNIIETSHEIQAKLNGEKVRMRVERVFQNLGKQDQELHLKIQLPPDTFVSGLEYNFSGKWTKAVFKSNHEAEAQYFSKPFKREPTGTKVRGAALFQKIDQHYLLRIFPLAASGTVKVRYKLEALANYKNREFSILYPQATDRKKFVEPVFFHSGKIKLTGKKVRKKVSLGYSVDLRCSDLDLPVSCHLIEVEVPNGSPKEISYFSTKLTRRLKQHSRGVARVPLLVVDPSGKTIPVQNCVPGTNTFTCRTPVKMKAGKWKFIFSSPPSTDLFNVEATFKNDLVNRTSRRRFHPGYEKVIFNAKSGPNEILLGRHPKDKQTQLEARMRKPFSVLPKRPRMIFLLDTSLSVKKRGIERQLNLLKSIVAHTDDETIEVLAYNRFVSYFTINPNDIEASLEANADALLLKNGSNLWAALDRAQVLTRKERRPTRIYVMSDLKLHEYRKFESSYDLSLPKNVVLHSVGIDGGRKNAILRDDRMNLSRFAKENRGIAVRLNPAMEYQLDKESLHLVRPSRVESVRVKNQRLPTIIEGETFMYIRYGRESYTLTGKLWQKSYRLKVNQSKKGDERFRRRRVAADIASKDEVLEFGKQHKVMTRYQSLVGIEAKKADGFRPQRRSVGGIGYGSRGHYNLGGAYYPRQIVRRTKVLKHAFKQVERTCKKFMRNTERYEASLTTIDFEIVSIRRDVNTKETNWSRCIHEGIWATELPNVVKTGAYPIRI